MERGELRALYVIGENPAVSEADRNRAERILSDARIPRRAGHLTLTQTAELADVVFPAAAGWCESEGTVTNSERRVQRVRKILDPPGEARDDIEIVCDIARRLGYDIGHPSAEDLWNEVRSLSPMHAGMSYKRLEEIGGLRWPCPTRSIRATGSCTRVFGKTRCAVSWPRSTSSCTSRQWTRSRRVSDTADHRSQA